MKNLTTIISESAGSNVYESDCVSYLSKEELRNYLSATSKLISKDARLVTAFLIDHPAMNSNGLLELRKRTGLEGAEAEVKEAIKKLQKFSRLKEIPVFQTPEEFQSIINGESTVDELILDFNTEAGRNEIVKKYLPMVKQEARKRLGQSNLDFDELVSAGLNGLTMAINKFGKSERVKYDPETGKNKLVSFTEFAVNQVRFYILEDIKKLSHTVRIPTSWQDEERRLCGSNTKSYTVSGDEVVGAGENGKTRFDIIGSESFSSEGAAENFARAMEELREHMLKHFNGQSRFVDIFLDLWGIGTEEPLTGKEIKAKYNVCASYQTDIRKRVMSWLQTDERARELAAEALEYLNESSAVKYNGAIINENGQNRKSWIHNRAGNKLLRMNVR